jgi:acylphosphatase
VAEGDDETLQRLLDLLVEVPSTTRRPGWIESVSSPLWSEPQGGDGFRER